jgi:2-polyprenyl-3-methyl-5-hydroxy-6-metoxy-1,4-benzoquinol methylase
MRSITVVVGDRICPLCAREGADSFHSDAARPYLHCSECSLVFVPVRWHVSAEAAKKRYDLHQNDPHDAGYRRFLGRLVDPMVARLPAGAHGLDVGCGPVPVLSLLFAEKGFRVDNYDLFYADDRNLLKVTYDFVACTETVEHFTQPAADWDRLIRLVKPGGLLGVMTERLEQGMDFGRWHYTNDITHIGFYSKRTLKWIADRYNLDVDFVAPTVAIFQS